MTRAALLLGIVLLPTLAAAQVADDFEDGNLTTAPTWTGDLARWRVADRGEGRWLNTDGAAQSDTLTLATPSAVSYGTWRFAFAHTGVNLSNANGVRIYLTADRADLSGDVRGYFVQIGTNNADEVRLYRQDGDPSVASNRVEIGRSAPLFTGDAGEGQFEVTRAADGTWTVRVDGTEVFSARDTTYARATHFGFWAKHSSTAGQGFYFDDVDVQGTTGPPDFVAPRIVMDAYDEALPGFDLDFSEPLDPASVTAGRVALSSGDALTVEPSDDFTNLRLRLAAPLGTGTYTLGIGGLHDAAGNALRDTVLTYEIVRDTDPPVLLSASASAPDRLFIRFDEVVVNGCAAERYALAPPDAAIIATTCAPGTPTDTLTLVLNAPLAAGQAYTLTAAGIEDRSGNVQASTSSALVVPDRPEAGDVIVNEILYAPPAGVPEYVELFNRSARTVDLSQLTLEDATGVPRALTPTPVLLTPGGYAVVTRDSAALAARFEISGALQPAAWPSLNNDGDAVVLRGAGTRLDSVAYTSAWGGNGASLERKDPGGSSGSASNWGTSTDARGGTPGTQNSVFAIDDSGPRVLAAEEVVPGQIAVSLSEEIDPVSVTASAFSLDDGQIVNAELAAPTRVALTYDLAASPSTLTVRGVRDLTGNLLRDTTVAIAFLPRPGEIVVNEILFTPLAAPDDGRPDQPEFVELLNTGNRAVTLNGLRIVGRPDEHGVADTLVLPSGVLPAGGFAVLYDADAADGEPATESRLARAFPSVDFRRPDVLLVPLANVTRNGLANDGERIRLQSGSTIIDDVDYVADWKDAGLATATGRSLERVRVLGASGDALNWATSGSADGATPGAPNDVAADPDARPPRPGDLVINEILYQPRADAGDGEPDQTEYVELYNRSDALLDLNGLYLLDAPDETGDADTTRLVFRPTPLAPGGFAVFFRIGGSYAASEMPADLFAEAFPGAEGSVLVPQRLAGFSLPDGGRALRLATHDGEMLDEVTYTPDWHAASLRDAAGVALERIEAGVSAAEPSNWSSSAAPHGGTPGARNTLTHDPSDPGGSTEPGLTIQPSPFSPDGDGMDDHATIAYRLKSPAASIRVRIFDQSGRLVRTLSRAQVAGPVGQVVWDGRDDDGRALRLGIYVVVLEALDTGEGASDVYRAPVVLARPLG